MMALIWKGDILVNNCVLYFIADLFNEYISKKITTFTIYRHISCGIIIFNVITGVIDNKIIICYNYISQNLYINNIHIFNNIAIVFTMLININYISNYWNMNYIQKLLIFILLLNNLK